MLLLVILVFSRMNSCIFIDVIWSIINALASSFSVLRIYLENYEVKKISYKIG